METRFAFNKKYTVRDALVKECIKYTLDFEKERTHSLHQDEYENKAKAKADMKKDVALGYGVGMGMGAAYGTLVGVGAGSLGLGTAIGGAAGATYGTVFSAGAIAGYTSKAIKARHANKQMEKQIKEIQDNANVDKKSGVKLKNKEMSMDDDMSFVNPGFNNWSDNTKNNCLLCSNAFALRRKGYDVMANGANDGYSQAVFLNFYPKAELTRVKLPQYIDKRTQPQLMNALGIPDGGYGAISVEWKGNAGGHSMIYSVENGKPVIRDCQTNDTYRGSKLNEILEHTTKDVRIVRLDNVEPDINAMVKAGAINPGGQNFKPKQTEAEKALESYKTPPAETSKASGKHGDTGFFDSKEVKAEKKAMKKVPNQEFRATGWGFEDSFKLTTAAKTEDGLKALYTTNTKTKSGDSIKVVVGASGDNHIANLSDMARGAKQASMLLAKEASVMSQAKKAIANAKDDYAQEYYSKSDLQNMAKSLKINRIEVNNGTEHPNVIFEAMSNPKDGYTELFDCSFKTLPNGKVILVDTRTGRDWF